MTGIYRRRITFESLNNVKQRKIDRHFVRALYGGSMSHRTVYFLMSPVKLIKTVFAVGVATRQHDRLYICVVV